MVCRHINVKFISITEGERISQRLVTLPALLNKRTLEINISWSLSTINLNKQELMLYPTKSLPLKQRN